MLESGIGPPVGATMTNSASDHLLATMAELRSLFPDWRMGQLIANFTQAGRDRDGAIWDVEDDQLLEAARRLIERNRPHRERFAEPPPALMHSGH